MRTSKTRGWGPLLALGAALSILLGAALPGGVASGVQSQTFSIAPLRGTWFHLDLAPGERYRGTVVLTNFGDVPLPGFLYSADAFTTPQGGFALNERPKLGDRVAAWAAMAPRRLVLGPRQHLEVPFTLTVPADAEPGDYAGGIVFERDPSDPQAAPDSQAAFSIIERAGARIYLAVAGERRAALSVRSVVRRGNVFTVTVRNDGNVSLHPGGSVEVTSMLGRKVRLDLPSGAALYPGESLGLTARWARPGLLGRFGAHAVITYGEGRTATGGTSFWLIPWLLVLAVLIGLVGLAKATWGGARWLRRARRALRETPAEPSAPASAPKVPARH